jgi:hypothetical protein
MSARPSARLRFLLSCTALPAVAVLGVVSAVGIPAARADVLPTVPTVTLPLPTVPSLPIGTTGTTTTPATGTGTSTDNGGGVNGTTTTATTTRSPDNANRGVAGAIRLSSGAISIPISSVTAPVSLAIDQVTIAPRSIGGRGQRLRVVVRVLDTRGYRVRGASVDVRSTPARMVQATTARKTSADGTVSLRLSTTSLIPMRTGFAVTLLVRAYRAGAVAGRTNVARRLVSVPVRPR